MREMLILLLGLSLAGSGCAVWQGSRQPNYVGYGPEPAVGTFPVFLIVTSEEARAEGVETKVARSTAQRMESALAKAMEKSPVMALAATSQTKPVHYFLFLDSVVDDHSTGADMLSFLTLALIPSVSSLNVSVTGSLYEAASGEELGVYEARGSRKMLTWLLLAPVTPLTLALGPGLEDVATLTYQDIFIQVAQALAGRGLPGAVDPATVEIPRKPPPTQRRPLQMMP